MIVDWLTITVRGNPDGVFQFEEWCRSNGLSILFDAEPVGELGSWRPYNRALGNSFFRLLWQEGAVWSSLAINGHGCEIARDVVDDLIRENPDAVTRIDIAQDLNPGTITPIEHAPMISARTKSVKTSDTGQTVYIGSRSSDAFVRFYMYEEPHERAGIPRIEAEFKRDYCSPVARAWTEGRHGEISAWIARKCNLSEYQLEIWGHEETKPLKMQSGKTPGQDGWQRWLHRAAIPAVRKALKAGIISENDILGDV